MGKDLDPEVVRRLDDFQSRLGDFFKLPPAIRKECMARCPPKFRKDLGREINRVLKERKERMDAIPDIVIPPNMSAEELDELSSGMLFW